MSLLTPNLRLFARFPIFIQTLRVNASMNTSNKINQVPIPTRPSQKYMRAGAIIIGIAGLYALFRASRREEQLIEHTIETQSQPSAASPSK